MEYIFYTFQRFVALFLQSTNIISFCLFGILCLLFWCSNKLSRSAVSKANVPGLKLRFYDITGDLKVLPKSAYRNQASNVYVLQCLAGYCNLFKNQKLCCFWMSYSPFILLKKAEAVEDLLSSTKVIEKAWSYNILHPWLGTGLLTSKGAKWKSRRKLLTPSFHFDILKDFIPVFNEQAEVLVNILEKETTREFVDIVTPVTLCSLDIICETTFGVHLGAQKNSSSEYVQAVLRASTISMDRMVNPKQWVDFIFYRTPTGIQFKKDLKVLHTFTKNLIQKKKALLEANVNKKEEEATEYIIRKKRKALLDLLLDHYMKYGNLTDEDIREEVDTFAFEGHDTTSMGMSWALYLIGLHPEIQRKIHEELDLIFSGDTNRTITPDDLRDMTYLECVLKESQRLYPSVPLFARQTREETEIGGYKIPKDSVCTVLTYVLHRDPDVFPNPEVFDPDRFLPENTQGRHPYAYVPFSAGPRNCIGQKFAMMEEKTVVASILRKFEIKSLDPRDKIQASADLILRPVCPLRIKISARKLP